MNIYCIDHDYLYETEKLIFLFLPFEKNKSFKEWDFPKTDYLRTEIIRGEEEIIFKAELSYKERTLSDSKSVSADNCKDEEYELLSLAYPLLKEICGYAPEWGMLTGVRPSKLMLNKIDEAGEEYAIDYFRNKFFASEEKTNLALSVARAERDIIKNSPEDSFSLYVSIPFCPTRCSYCSFVSHAIGTESAKKLVPEYVDKLCREIELTARLVKKQGLRLTTVYWGGGTPTSLEADQLDRVLTAIEENFDLSECFEYTVEAGRPDTVTEEKLRVLKNHKVGRISINPQTFSDSVLESIGRRHSASLTEEKYLLARKVGFDSINMDLIAGLPTDTYENFCKSVNRAVELGADNITVHTLALKKSSAIVTEKEKDSVNSANIEKMLDYASGVLTENGYHPYYMYRQSKALGNFENVGWCKPDKECAYNILMMEEYQHIISVGASAVTKLLSPKITKIERIFNYKYPFEYISRFDTLMEKKERISSFFEECK